MGNGNDAARVACTLDCNWGFTTDTPRNGKITSLSLRNCFVKTKAIVNEGQKVYVRCWLPSRSWLALSGTVKISQERVGFSYSFDELTDEQRPVLESLMAYYRDKAGRADADAAPDPETPPEN